MAARKVRIVPIIGANEPIEIELPEETSVGEAIIQAFPNVGGDLVIQDESNRPMSASARLRDGQQILFMPHTTGGEQRRDHWTELKLR